jgi:hypothetical protein
MATTGRPLILSPAVIDEFRRLLPTVLYMESAGDFLGIQRSTWGLWLRRGRKEYNRLQRSPGEGPSEAESLYLGFFAAVKKGLAEGEIADAATIKKAAAVQWQAAAWRLERRSPDRWGRDRGQIKELQQLAEDLARRVAELTGVNHNGEK